MEQKPGIRSTPIEALTLHPDNPRHGDIGAIMQSIEQNGFVGVLVAQCSTGRVITGNHRLQAAANLGFTKLKVEWKDCSDEEALRLLLADNRTSDLATNDDAVIADLLMSLAETDAGFDGTGYDGDDLDDLLADLGRDELAGPEPSIPDLPTDPITKPGDVIIMGEHRLICGDATDASIMPATVDCVLTDPPYGMNLDTDYSKMGEAAKGGTYAPIIGDDQPFDMSVIPVPDTKEQFWFGADWYRHTTPHEGVFLAWDKRVDPTHDAVIGSMFELIWSRQRHQRVLFRYPWTAYDQQHLSDSSLHPTQKPIALLEDIINRWTHPGDHILDPFAGSGSTLIAAHNTSRRVTLIELDPGYCDVIVQRWENHTGQTATRP